MPHITTRCILVTKPKLPETPEAFSLFGEPLNQQPPRPEVVEKQKALYDKALMDWEKKTRRR